MAGHVRQVAVNDVGLLAVNIRIRIRIIIRRDDVIRAYFLVVFLENAPDRQRAGIFIILGRAVNHAAKDRFRRGIRNAVKPLIQLCRNVFGRLGSGEFIRKTRCLRIDNDHFKIVDLDAAQDASAHARVDKTPLLDQA